MAGVKEEEEEEEEEGLLRLAEIKQVEVRWFARASGKEMLLLLMMMMMMMLLLLLLLTMTMTMTMLEGAAGHWRTWAQRWSAGNNTEIPY